MDKLAQRLREDADQIEIQVSPELENRIHASLHALRNDRELPRSSSQSASFWWASGLTGVAATLAIVAFVNLSGPEPQVGITEPPQQQAFSVPQFDWQLETAMLTETLEQELVDIQSDLKKAEQTVRDDLDEIM